MALASRGDSYAAGQVYGAVSDRESLSIWFWGAAMPLAVVALAWISPLGALGMAGLYPALLVRIYLRTRRRGVDQGRNGTAGVEAASELYFGRPARELSPAQAALLAGLAHAPAREDGRMRNADALRETGNHHARDGIHRDQREPRPGTHASRVLRRRHAGGARTQGLTQPSTQRRILRG